MTVERSEEDVRAFLQDPASVRRFSPDGTWSGHFELRAAPGDRGTEIHASADPADLRRAEQLLQAGELATANGGAAGRRGILSAVLPTQAVRRFDRGHLKLQKLHLEDFIDAENVRTLDEPLGQLSARVHKEAPEEFQSIVRTAKVRLSSCRAPPAA